MTGEWGQWFSPWRVQNWTKRWMLLWCGEGVIPLWDGAWNKRIFVAVFLHSNVCVREAEVFLDLRVLRVVAQRSSWMSSADSLCTVLYMRISRDWALCSWKVGHSSLDMKPVTTPSSRRYYLQTNRATHRRTISNLWMSFRRWGPRQHMHIQSADKSSFCMQPPWLNFCSSTELYAAFQSTVCFGLHLVNVVCPGQVVGYDDTEVWVVVDPFQCRLPWVTGVYTIFVTGGHAKVAQKLIK